ncbi:hypothetical protein HSX10_17590 [Winogradskyella undariae]|uniref:hypothetical protein n=1 Tax=Winogradskyella undariae TaxID=1285465 RepID=UPI00156AA7A0|nr:hypothetical protein [Winogradskyella undariae]NRR93391.1 hypothetical protein [Winogradskyella undariae]
MILDKYFRRPVLYDYLISLVVAIILFVVYSKGIFNLPKDERSLSMTSDLANVGLTSAGFILTLLTVLITFKSSSKINKKNYSDDDSLFDLFFSSELYFMTVRILKNCIKSLILISVIGFALKLAIPKDFLKYVFFYNIFGLIIIALTLYRCLLVLTKVLKMQE